MGMIVLLAIAIIASGCAASPSSPAPAASAGAGTTVAGAGTAVAARLAPTGATAPIDPAAWALADRLTAASYTADTTSAMVAALARAGIATFNDSSSLSPEVPLTAAASPLELLDFQAHALAVGVWTGASWSGAELDSLMPIPAGSTDAAPASVLLASYVAAVDSPGAALARAVMAGQNLLNPATVRFPGLVLFLFASDLATGGGQASPAGSPAPSASAAALTGGRQLADVGQPANGLDPILLADPVGGICSDAANWIHTTISRLFDALKLAEPSNVIGKIFVTIWNFAVDVLHSFVEGVITSVTDEVLGSIRSVAATISGVAEQIASLLPYGVHVAVTGGDFGPDFNLGSSARPGSYVATITAGDLPDWPAILKDCAAVAKIQLPDFSSKSIPITWGPVTTEGGTAALLAGDDATKGNDTTDKTGQATWAFTVAPDPGQATGEDVTQADEMPVAAHRPELTQLRNALTNALLGFVPSLLRGFVQQELLNPTLEKVQGSLNEILDARGYTDAFLHYHEQASPKPSSATASGGTASCTVSLPAGTYVGTFATKSTTIIPQGEIDLGEGGGSNDSGTGPVSITVAGDGSLTGTFQQILQQHMVWTGLAEGTADTTIEEDGQGVSGTLCNPIFTFAKETITACTKTGHGLCGGVGGTYSLVGLMPPLPLGAPTSVGGGAVTWSLSSEGGADAGFGGLSAEVQTTITVTISTP
ncbi:MAG TPA: hypothetical protein VKR24_05840 [Candidatus Limnocylindrales bacterium]|nr:hypothetical protein [Candidatus Limnocylindrales bacterium]